MNNQMKRGQIILAALTILFTDAIWSVPDNVALNKQVSFSNKTEGSDSVDVTVNGDTSATYITSASTSCTGCFIAQNDEKKWWMVDLEKEYFLTGITLNTGEKSYFLKNVDVLSTTNESLVEIGEHHDSWYTIKNSISGSATVDMLIQPASSARYVALFAKKGDSIHLSEVQIYGYETNAFKPTEFKFIDVDSKSISFEWKPPDENNTIQVDYEYKCSDGDTWTDIGNVLAIKHTGLTTELFDAGVTCTLRVKGYELTSVSQTLLCSDAYKVWEFSIGFPQRVLADRRKRWRYSISWKPPGGYDCIETESPYRLEVLKGNKENDTMDLSLPNYQFDVDGGVSVQITVWLKSRNGILSQETTTLTESSTDIAPQIAPTNLSATATSSQCVRLTWLPVAFPNGPVDGISYHVNCGGLGWKASTSGQQDCDHEPYTEVECQVQARRDANSIGNQNSRVAIASAITQCGEPSKPVLSTKTVKTEDLNITLTITWEASEPMCERIIEYNLELASVSGTVAQQSYARDEERKFVIKVFQATAYTVTVTAVNNQQLKTESKLQLRTANLECDAPPPQPINNSRILESQTGGWHLNSTVLYECEDGYDAKGTNVLRCVWNDGKPMWVRDTSVCTKIDDPNEEKDTIPAIIAGTSSAAVLVIGVGILLAVLHRLRKKKTNTKKDKKVETHADTESSFTSRTMSSRPTEPIYDPPCNSGRNETPEPIQTPKLFEDTSSIYQNMTCGQVYVNMNSIDQGAEADPYANVYCATRNYGYASSEENRSSVQVDVSSEYSLESEPSGFGNKELQAAILKLKPTGRK